MDTAYEAITNYLDEKRLESKDLFIEQYDEGSGHGRRASSPSTYWCCSSSAAPLMNYTGTTSPGRKAAESLGRNVSSLQGVGQRDERRIDRFVGELEGAVMVGERQLGAAVDKRPDRLGRVHVLVLHEPTRLIGADRQDGEPERPMVVARRAGNSRPSP